MIDTVAVPITPAFISEQIKNLANETIHSNYAFTLSQTILKKVGGCCGLNIICDAVKAGVPLDKLGVFKTPALTVDIFNSYSDFFIEHVETMAAQCDTIAENWLISLSAGLITPKQVLGTYGFMKEPEKEGNEFWRRSFLTAKGCEQYSSYAILRHLIVIDAITAMVHEIIHVSSDIPF